jgi:uncharacterized caspase-like protein
MFARRWFVAFFIMSVALIGGSAGADAQQRRIGLVVGISTYPDGTLATPVNDAALVAEALRSAGFELVQGADLDEPALRRAVRDFLDRARAAGPDSVAMVYFAGRGAQLEGDDFLIPSGTRIDRAEDIPLVGLRVSDLVRSLGESGGLRLFVLDAAHELPERVTGALAPGLAAIEAPKNWLVAQSTLPDLVLPETEGPYGVYAKALVEMMRVPGLDLDEMFAKIRLRVHEGSGGVQVPWHDASLEGVDFAFYDPEDPAAVRAAPRPARRVIADTPLRALGPREAYSVVIERDEIPLYQDYVALYPESPFTPRIIALVVLRRETAIWHQSRRRDTREAYWTYLRRYPDGFHAHDARRRLARLSAPPFPPDRFDAIDYAGLPPPPPFLERADSRALVRDFYDMPPPPPPPMILLPPQPREILVLPPPPPPSPGVLPVPVAVPVPHWAKRRAPPPEPVVVRPLVAPQPAPPVQPRRAPIRAGAPDTRPLPDAIAPLTDRPGLQRAAPTEEPTPARPVPQPLRPRETPPAADDRAAPRPGAAQDRVPDRPRGVEDRRPGVASPPAQPGPKREPEGVGSARPADRPRPADTVRPGAEPRPDRAPARRAPDVEDRGRASDADERRAAPGRPDREDRPRALPPRLDAPRGEPPRNAPSRPDRPEPRIMQRPEPPHSAPAPLRLRGPDPEATGSRTAPTPAEPRRPEAPRFSPPPAELRRQEPTRALPPPVAIPGPVPALSAPRPEPPRAASPPTESPKAAPQSGPKGPHGGERACGVPGKPPCR